MGRAIGGVVLGYAVWSVLWIGFNAALQSALPDIVIPTERLEHVGVLGALVLYSAVISAVSGFVCAAVRGDHPMKAVWVLAGCLLLTGIPVEISYWSLMPAWYHLTFLVLLVPATVWGGRLRERRASTAS